MGLAFLIVVLLTPVDAYERDKMLPDNELSYEQYFEMNMVFILTILQKSKSISSVSHNFSAVV